MPNKLTTEDFIEKAKAVHGNKYDYSLVEYISNHVKIKIICKSHGEFEQIPTSHIHGKSGCPKCTRKNKTTDEFIQEAKKIHENKYDYSLVEYVGSNIKVKIICKKHGEFKQRPYAHLLGQGCPSCNVLKKSTTEEFIQKSKKAHGDKYDYSLVDYKNANTKIIIVCPIHGNFLQSPNNHLLGCNCQKCSNVEDKSTESFVREAKLIHGNKYDYSLVDYKNNKTKIKIICSIHGVFEQTPAGHLKGDGCRKCANIWLTTEEFVAKAKLVHGDKYDYSLVNYKNSHKKIDIICKTHGVFKQMAYSHLNGKGCSKCSDDKILLTNDKIIEQARKIHGDKYNYDKLVYSNPKTKIIIICPIHGEFKQLVNHHSSGSGCPICKESKGEKKIRELITNNNIIFIPQNKFPECIDIKQLPFDFYLINFNSCIEFHGSQHYYSIKYFGGEDRFKDQSAKDKIKENYCKDNNIPLIIIFKKHYYEKKFNFVDLYNNFPKEIKHIFIENNFLQYSIEEYNIFKEDMLIRSF